MERHPITGRIIKAKYLDANAEEAADDDHEEKRCPITGKLLNGKDDGEKRCPITGKLLSGHDDMESEEEDDTASSSRIPDEFGFASRLSGYDSLYSSAFNRGAEPRNSFGGFDSFVQDGLKRREPEPEPERPAERPSRGGASPAPGAAEANAVRRRNLKVKDYAGQTDHEPQPHADWYDWRTHDPTRFPKDIYDDCKWPKDVKNLDTPEYQMLSAKCKEELVWRNCLEDETRELFFVGPEFQSLFDQDMNHSYDTVSDSMPVGRVKVTHPVGTVTKIELIAHPESPYTGIFRGAKHGIMRISDTTKTTPEVSKTNPGHGVKFFRDGMYSANWLAMFHFDGHKSFNFFKNRWTTILREPNNMCARETIGKHLATVTDHIGGTSVMDVAQFDQYGNKEEHPHWPYQLDIEAYDVYGWTDEYQNDF